MQINNQYTHKYTIFVLIMTVQSPSRFYYNKITKPPFLSFKNLFL